MAIPRAVQRKAERARELAANSGQPRPQAPAPSATNATEQPPQGPVETQVREEVPPQESGEQDAPSGMDGTSRVDLDDWKTRYTNLRKARNESTEKAERRVAQLEKENADLRKQLAETSAPKDAPSPFELSEEEREGLSAEAQRAYELAAKKLGGQLQQQEQDDVAAREAAFFADVESVVPNWEEVNSSAGFINWLQAEDGFSGRSRLETLQAARANLDARTVTSLFSAYEGEVNGSGSNGAGTRVPTTVVEPGRSSTVSDPRSAQGSQSTEIISQAEVQAFYRKKNELARRKKLHGEVAQQYAARDAEIRRAHAEGRIR